MPAIVAPALWKPAPRRTLSARLKHFPGVRLKPLGHPSQHRFEARTIEMSRSRLRATTTTDRERFELSIPGSPVCRFSRPVPSTTRPPVLQPRNLSGEECFFNRDIRSDHAPLRGHCGPFRRRVYRIGSSNFTFEMVVVDGSRLGVRYGLSTFETSSRILWFAATVQ
jgi:hypothetical protein